MMELLRSYAIGVELSKAKYLRSMEYKVSLLAFCSAALRRSASRVRYTEGASREAPHSKPAILIASLIDVLKPGPTRPDLAANPRQPCCWVDMRHGKR